MSDIIPLWVVATPNTVCCSNCNWYKPQSDTINRKGRCTLAGANTVHNESCEGFVAYGAVDDSYTVDDMLKQKLLQAEEIRRQALKQFNSLVDEEYQIPED